MRVLCRTIKDLFKNYPLNGIDRDKGWGGGYCCMGEIY